MARKITYEIWAFGYDQDDNITDEEQLLGIFDNEEDANEALDHVTEHDLHIEAPTIDVQLEKDITYDNGDTHCLDILGSVLFTLT